MRDFAWRLNAAAEKAGLSQADIAGQLGVSPSRVGNWFQGRHLPLKREREQLAALLGKSVDWLLTGTEPVSAVEEQTAIYEGIPATEVREIPVVSWAHAGQAAAYEEIPKHMQGTVSTNTRDKKAFALTIEGDSMEPKFLQGDLVVLEPSNPPINGKPVVVRFVDDAVQLRLYLKLPGGKIRLAPYNQVYPTIEYHSKDFLWIFPVKQLIRVV